MSLKIQEKMLNIEMLAKIGDLLKKKVSNAVVTNPWNSV